MLALRFLRYWWLSPRPPDPIQNKDQMSESDKRRSKSMTSQFDPLSGPQYDTIQNWTKISYATLDSMQQSILDIEKALAEKKDLILVEPSTAGQVYAHYLNHGWLLHENILIYGGVGLTVSYFFPTKWMIYVPCSVLALMHSWLFFGVYKHDRLSAYQAYDDNRHPVSAILTAGVLGQRPNHFRFILKRERVIVWEILSGVTVSSALISTLISLRNIGRLVVKEQFISSVVESGHSMAELLSLPAYASGYFQPPELIPVATPGTYLPSDIPNITGVFHLPGLSFRLKHMKFDLALISCVMGGYFMYKLFENIFGLADDDDENETNILGREWFANEATIPRFNATKNPNWVEPNEGNGENYLPLETGIQLTTFQSLKPRKIVEEQEERMITKICNQIPYGWTPTGYSPNHYGTFT